MRLCFLGDTHGYVEDMYDAINMAAAGRADEIIQVGDWGFIWPGEDRWPYVERMLASVGMTQRYIDGNHDDHPRLRALPEGAGNTSPHLTYQPRGSIVGYPDGTLVGFLGGAPSIDRAHRVPGRSWWPEEEILESDVLELGCNMQAAGRPLDILVTHDAPYLPLGIGGTRDTDFLARQGHSHRMIREAIIASRPRLLVHGHYHTRYTQQALVDDHFFQIEGLDHAGCGRTEDFLLMIDTDEWRHR